MTSYSFTQPQNQKELGRLLTAAVVNQRFCSILLNNPARALASGYFGESFRIETEERARILSIRANSLADFAYQLSRLYYPNNR